MKTLNEFLNERAIKGTKQHKVQDENFVLMGFNNRKVSTVKELQGLLDNNVDVDSLYQERTLLFYIISMADTYPKIELLLEYGANPNFKDEFGVSVLHRLLINKDLTLSEKLKRVKLLIKYKVDINDKSKNGNTPLDYVEDYNYKDIELIAELQSLGFK